MLNDNAGLPPHNNFQAILTPNAHTGGVILLFCLLLCKSVALYMALPCYRPSSLWSSTSSINKWLRCPTNFQIPLSSSVRAHVHLRALAFPFPFFFLILTIRILLSTIIVDVKYILHDGMIRMINSSIFYDSLKSIRTRARAQAHAHARAHARA